MGTSEKKISMDQSSYNKVILSETDSLTYSWSELSVGSHPQGLNIWKQLEVPSQPNGLVSPAN